MEYGYSIERIALKRPTEEAQLRSFLLRHHLSLEDDIEVAFGIYDPSYQLVGCGCAAGNLLKCFAVDEELRGQNALGILVSCLVSERFSSGHYDLFVITRSENEPLFSGCGLSKVVRTKTLVLMENRSDGPEKYALSMRHLEDEGKQAGAIVMNCNPFTLGHRRLVEFAADQCEVLYLFVVEEDRSFFPTNVRLELVREGVSNISNVHVCPSGNYMISKETFPTYFLKDDEDAGRLQAELDITLFAERIAPLFNITKRFSGQEPFDTVTAAYNEAMRKILPNYGIEFFEIPRFEQQGETISASKVRQLLANPETYERAYPFVPESTRKYLEQQKIILTSKKHLARSGRKGRSKFC